MRRKERAGRNGHVLRIIGTARWSIGRVLDAREMNENKIVAGKKFGPTGLTAIEDLGGHEAFEVLMIREDLNRVARSLKIMTPVTHAFNHGEHFPVGNIIIALSSGAFPRIKGNRVPRRTVKLTEDA
jgi:hypothetical protein